MSDDDNVIKGPWVGGRGTTMTGAATPPPEHFAGLALGRLFRVMEEVYDKSKLAQRMAAAAARKRRMKAVR